jgi:hypothetical protein
MLASLVVVPVRAMAVGTFTGGADQFPVLVPNDHTPIAVHFSGGGGVAATLAPNTVYYVKVRFTPGLLPGGADNRGYTWNPVLGRWAQERDPLNWPIFPTVTTNASGVIDGDSGWMFVKFGNELSGGTYHLMISLSNGGKGETLNGSILPTVTVYDPNVTGGWVHDGIATGVAGGLTARLSAESSTAVLGLQKTEPNLADDDSDLITDNEDYGPSGAVGDFRMAVPLVSAPLELYLDSNRWLAGTSLVTGPAGADIALGASDMSAPTAPGAISVRSGDTTASISWAAATDDVGVAGYYVYRWPVLTLGNVSYSPLHARIATLGPGERSFSDTGLTDGTTYLYEVRAFDAATNVSPRSGPATATPAAVVPGVSVSPASPDGDNGWYVSTPIVTLSPSSPGRTVKYTFQSSPTAWTTYNGPVAIGGGRHQTFYYCETDGTTTSTVQSIVFYVDLSMPTVSVSAPSYTVQQSASRSFTVSWSGTDTESGVAGYDVQVRAGTTGAWTPLLASTATTSTPYTGTYGQTYYFQVQATDAASIGHKSAYVTSGGTTVPYDQSKAKFSSGWATQSRSSAFMGSFKYTSRRSAYSTLTLSKGTLYLVANMGPKFGKLTVYFRGHRVRTIDTYSRTSKTRQLIKLTSFTGHGSGTVKIVNQATSRRSRVEVDGFAFR